MMNGNHLKKKKLASIVLAAALLLPSAGFAETREELEQELKKVEAQIAQYENDLSQTKTQKNTLTNKIAQLKKEQEKIALQIRKVNLQISELGKQMDATELSIQATQDKLAASERQSGAILRALDQKNRKSLLETLLEEQSISDFFLTLGTFEALSQDLAMAIGEVKEAKSDLETQYATLEVKREDKKNFLSLQTIQRKNLEVKTGEQNKLLVETKGKETRYQAMLADSKKRAQEIRSRIYELLGVSRQITFGQAVDIAKWVSGRTGVRTELILAVLTQESNLGKNIGTCNRPNDPPSKSWRQVMKPGRDQEPFLAITQELGLNPDITPVSCPMKDAGGNYFGWGGAMGPAQFIPSTWALYKDRVSAITGRKANPWDTRDAFIAAALLLKDNGAAQGGEQAEWRAAMLYFSGSTNPRFRFYGDNVVALAKGYEDDIRAIG